MPRIYELPTHLGVEDQLIGTLTARQLLRIAVGASLGYVVWDRLRWIPDELRLTAALAVAAIGVIFAVVRPGARSLDQWLLAWLLFVVLPHHLIWRSGGGPSDQSPPDEPEWSELELSPGWLDAGAAPNVGPTSTSLLIHSQFLSKWRK
jgi:hypothetical protein